MENVRMKLRLLEGFQSDPKFFPDGFAYDKTGLDLREEYITCTSNYFHKAESDLLFNTPEIFLALPRFPALVEIGETPEELRNLFIEKCLEKIQTLEYYPMRPSEDECSELSRRVEDIYEKRVDPRPIVEDIVDGLERINLSNKSFRKQKEKVILWFGGRFHGYPEEKQHYILSKVADAMKRSDLLLLTVDVTKDVEQINQAYMDPEGYASRIYLNNITRLNREFGSKMKAKNFKVEATFIEDNGVQSSSYVHAWIRSLSAQSIKIPKLGTTLKLQEDEKVFVHEGCTYTEAQLADLGTRSGLFLQHFWCNQHVALCGFRTRAAL